MQLVHACRRGGRGGSPTAVLDEIPMSDADRRALPAEYGTSHVVFLAETGPAAGPAAGAATGAATGAKIEIGASLRFFTSTGELPACGHGTVAALAVLAQRSGHPDVTATLRSGGRVHHGRATRNGDLYEATFDPGPVDLRTPTTAEREAVLGALGLAGEPSRIASVGRPRMLVQVANRASLAALTPDQARLKQACDRYGLLGCYVYSTPTPGGRAAARMFAPSIGVPEDIANANSTACLAAHLGFPTLAVDMGDSLGEPATILASTPGGLRVGGTAFIAP